ncbi:trypco2 family protein [Streptomyces sp. XY431]|uniref:trypco2 family protein n=1 Tax=Streptomyces sp. XY431 TaxID=1415562 RepID=UPI0006AE1426|nr:trypco2 family protein [Streptomyces sp. XY431]
MEFDGTELSEAIAAVRAGLIAAQRSGADSEIRFTVKDVVVDLGLELRRVGGAGGGVKAFVFSGEARAEQSNGQTHRLTVTLGVVGGDAVPISGSGEVGLPEGGYSLR